MPHEVLTVERAPFAARTARRWVRQQAATVVGDPAKLGDIELATSELVSNAVEHGDGPTLDVRVETSSDGVVLEVVSRSAAEAVRDALGRARDPAPPGRPTGRGLAIVASLSDDVRVIADPPHTTVRCRFTT